MASGPQGATPAGAGSVLPGVRRVQERRVGQGERPRVEGVQIQAANQVLGGLEMGKALEKGQQGPGRSQACSGQEWGVDEMGYELIIVRLPVLRSSGVVVII